MRLSFCILVLKDKESSKKGGHNEVQKLIYPVSIGKVTLKNRFALRLWDLRSWQMRQVRVNRMMD